MNGNFSKEDLEKFAKSANNFFSFTASDQIDFFVYFLTIKKDKGTTQATGIRDCFLLLELTPYSNISGYLLSHVKGKGKAPPKYLRIKDGYQLHRSRRTFIEDTLNKKPHKVKVDKELRELLHHIKNPAANEFLKEAINCFEIEAYRAAIIMVWNLTMDHLYEYILNHELANFNLVLSKNNDKRIRISSISKKDDLTEIPEAKFIEFCRTSKIISNDIRKILDTKLGIRNTYAHPSGVKMLEIKAIEFIEDLVNNVVLKYKL